MFILFKTSYVKSKLGRTVANICACISKHLMLNPNPVVKAIFNKYTFKTSYVKSKRKMKLQFHRHPYFKASHVKSKRVDLKRMK